MNAGGLSLRLSAIVPTLNESAEIERTLRSLRAGGVDEVVVVDGGSSDSTTVLARPLADAVLHSGGGLFEQLNCGAAAAGGDVLLFHYADVKFPAQGGRAIVDALQRRDVVGGAFALDFMSQASHYRVIAGGANLRNRLRFGPFGDQSIFSRRTIFDELGGFRSDRFLADLEFVRRLRSHGRFALLRERVRTSVRRWERMGVARTLQHHWWLSALYLLGKRRECLRAACTATTLRTIR